jgi:hypothetical protein
MVNKYLGKFNEQGKPEGFMLEGINYKTVEKKAEYMAEGWVELTQDEWEYYTGNKGQGDNGTGYLRDPATGQPVSAPPIVYTKQQLADMAYSSCQSVVTANENELVKATALGEDEDYIQELRDEIAAAEDLYSRRLDAIERGEITNPTELNEYGVDDE